MAGGSAGRFAREHALSVLSGMDELFVPFKAGGTAGCFIVNPSRNIHLFRDFFIF